MIASGSFVRDFLPGGVVPNDDTLGHDAAEALVDVPFAVLRWDDGLDYNLDGSSYQDSPPDWEVAGAFDKREDAERLLRDLLHCHNQAEIATNIRYPLYTFAGAYVR